MSGNEMGRAKPVALEGNRAQYIVGDTITQLDVLVKQPQDTSYERLVLALLLSLGTFLHDERLDRSLETGIGLQEATNPAPSDALEYDACVSVLKSRHLQDLRNDPDTVKIVLGGILHLNVSLRQEEEVAFAFLGLLERGERWWSADQHG